LPRAVASIVSVQNHYNLGDRSSDRLVDICAEAGIAFIPWYPLAAGQLASANSPLARIAQRHSATSVGNASSRSGTESSQTLCWRRQVSSEPVSEAKFCDYWLEIIAQIQWFTTQFPAHRNREFNSALQGINSGNQGIFSRDQGIRRWPRFHCDVKPNVRPTRG
jgi:hypothetical protein